MEKYQGYQIKTDTIIDEFQKHISDLYRYSADPRWLITNQTHVSDGIFQVPASVSPTQQPVMVWDLGRVCYHCDATDGVTGVVPLCRKCR